MSTSQRIFIEPLNVNPYFADFNIDGLGPQIKEGPTELRLHELVYEGRCGRKQALFEFADVMYYTLREEAFEAFQRRHGPLENAFPEWFHEKLDQFFRILLFESVRVSRCVDRSVLFKDTDFPVGKEFTIVRFNDEGIQPDETEQVIEPEHNSHRLWYELAQSVTERPKDRLKAAREWLAKFRRQYELPRSFETGWGKNQERNRIIFKYLDRGMARADVCKELDKHTVETIRALQVRGLHKWVDGWKDREGRKAIQRLFSKLLTRIA